MPLQPKQLSRKEVIVARERAQPAICTILDRLLRGGAACYLEFERKLLKACEVACTMHRFTGTDGRTRFEKKKYIRVNPEDMKRSLQSCGVLLDGEQYRLIRLAYSDPVGFVLSNPLLSAVCPLGQVPADLVRMLISALPPAPAPAADTMMGVGGGGGAAPAAPAAPVAPPAALSSEEEKEANGFIGLPDLYLDGVLCTLASVFGAEEGEEGAEDDATTKAFNSGAYEEALRCFTAEYYPDQRVPAVSVLNFIAAQLLLLYANTSVSDEVFTGIAVALEKRLSTCCGQLVAAPPLTSKEMRKAALAARGGHRGHAPAAPPSAAAIAAATINTDKTSSIYDFSMTHTNVPRRPHKFEYYMQLDDRRDEWLRGRQERDAGGMYMKHTVGYAGHLPEFQYHFGRTFHVIEEDLPNLTKPKVLQEPLTADAFGPGRALKRNQITEHHFTLS